VSNNNNNDGWAGHILLLDLTRRQAKAMPTEKYKRWGGGHGLGTALFWDYSEDKTLTDGRDRRNICVLSASPFCGALVPSGGGRPEFAKVFLECIAQQTDIGADLADGYMHALHKWKREEDLETGEADFPYWGMANHGYDPRSELEWGYGTIMSDRDLNSRDINLHLFWQPFLAAVKAKPMRIEAEDAVGFIAARLRPYAKGRKECFDYRDSRISTSRNWRDRPNCFTLPVLIGPHSGPYASRCQGVGSAVRADGPRNDA
jgi:aldehyde:ferredoxin oxidoreductase